MGSARRRSANARQKWLLLGGSTVVALSILALLELALTLFDVADPLEDPFFDYEAVTGLFEPAQGTVAGDVYRTRESKTKLFNPQGFPMVKRPGTFRVFALGGSTTHGRPYDWRVAFPNWLQLLLEGSRPGHPIEVINAGGVSYASHRVRVLVEELLNYEPDLLVVYSGHNEFLEERAYGDRLREGAALRLARRHLSGLRTVRWIRGWFGAGSSGAITEGTDGKQRVAAEVQTRLDVWDGLNSFTRDEALKRDVVAHFEWNLQAMVQLADAAGVPMVFVAPPSNALGFSPFKSEHRAELSADDAARFTTLVDSAADDLRAGAAASALASLEQAVQLDGEFANAHFLLGKAYLAADRPADAEAALMRAIDLDVCPLRAPTAIVEAVREVSSEAGVPLVDLPGILAERGRSSKGHGALGNDEFIDHVHPKIEVHQLVAELLVDQIVENGWLKLGITLTRAQRDAIYGRVMEGLDRDYYARRDLNLSKVLSWAGKYAEATEALMRSREQLVGNADMHFTLGVLLLRQGEAAAALEELQRAIAAQPDHASARVQAGRALAALGRNDEAMASFRDSARADPSNAVGFYNWAMAAHRQGDHAEALNALAELAKVDPDYPGLWLLRGQVLIGQGRSEDAIQALEQGIRQDPKSTDTHFYLGLARSHVEDWRGAEEALNQVLSAQPDHYHALRGMAQLEAAQGRDAEAVAAFMRAIEAIPDDPSLRFELGAHHHHHRRLEEAVAAYEAAAELDPGHFRAHNNLGAVWLSLRDIARATASFERALAINPKDGGVHYSLAQLKLATGDRGAARRHAEQARKLGIQPSQAFLNSLGN